MFDKFTRWCMTVEEPWGFLIYMAVGGACGLFLALLVGLFVSSLLPMGV